MPSSPADRRHGPRVSTAFLALERREGGLCYRLVRDLSTGGFLLDGDSPVERPGDGIQMEFPLPGCPHPIDVRGEVVHVSPERGVGVRIVAVDREEYQRLMAVPPPPRRP
jgi:hypothetical protein